MAACCRRTIGSPVGSRWFVPGMAAWKGVAGRRRAAGKRVRGGHLRGNRAATGYGDRIGCNSQARRDERGGKAGRWWSETSVGCGRSREQQQLSDRRGTRRRPSTVELGGNLLRCGDGPSDAHGPAAAGAHGDVHAEDAGEERHPGHARRGSIAELSVQQGDDGGEFELAARDEEGQLLGLGLVGTRHDGTAQLVVG